MASIKVLLDKRRIKKDNQYPIVIRVFHDSKSASFATGISVAEKEWDEKKCRVNRLQISHEKLNLLLKKKLIEVEEKLLDASISRDKLTLNVVRDRVHGVEEVATVGFFSYTKSLINIQLQSGKVGNVLVYECALNQLSKFVGHTHYTFDDLNFNLLERFQAKLLSQGIKQNSIAVYLRTIRAIFNRAINEGVISAQLYPFRAFTIKHEKTNQRTLSESELLKIIALPLVPNTAIWHHRNYFLLSFSLIGISFIDLVNLERANIQNGRIIYKRKKTGRFYSIKITKSAADLLATYFDETRKYLLPIKNSEKQDSLIEKKRILQHIKISNKYLKRIGEMCDLSIPLTSYCSRYSWANIARNNGFSKDLIAEALGHEYGNKVTGIYLDTFPTHLIDEANEKITTKLFSM